ncbi:hypothetical protein ATANTOWER_024251 [Ataeniobius toweri]|uniref:Uncharacterized protein n=1 Tax=Ataeniobius toweri TaxID=208326 RepID=A0ABU7BRY4_9TELE|nr:hypothetical protein [Ataeniobius toweri]
MIDDRMTLLDPVEELCLFASKETLAHCASPVPVVTVVEEIEPLERWGFYTGSSIMGSPLLPSTSCAGSKVNAIYFESSRKVRTAFPVATMAVGPNMCKCSGTMVSSTHDSFNLSK